MQKFILIFTVMILACLSFSGCQEANADYTPKAPLFRDPVYDGASDPTIIFNRQEKNWWIFYTGRRANIADTSDTKWVHGSDMGMCSSSDGGKTWVYRGIARGLDFEPGRNTFWAPEVMYGEGKYHMYVSYLKGIRSSWIGDRDIIHYTSNNLIDWKFESILKLSSKAVIDACVYRVGDKWRMWYKDEADKSHTYAADSDDLYNWKVVGPALTDFSHEAPNVFKWKNYYWIAIDTWKGIGIYRSTDAENWVHCPNIIVEPGTRDTDKGHGHHPDILVQGDRAFIFYFTYPQPGSRSVLQVAELGFENDQITCDRNKVFQMKLKNPK